MKASTRKLAAALKRRRIRHSVSANGLPGTPDFLVLAESGAMIAVFVCGRDCYKTESDRRKLRRLGFRTMMVLQRHVTRDVERVADKIGRWSKR